MHLSEAPYPGLRPFRSEETDIFFGREKQVDELLLRLSKTRFLPVIGPSGCGKSSLVRAGLLASLESGFIAEAGGNWRILAMMPRERPIKELANALAELAPEASEEGNSKALQATLRSGPQGLIEALKERVSPSRENVLLLVDQFEEVFRFREQQRAFDPLSPSDSFFQRSKDEADAFVTLLLETAKQNAAYIVLTMRSDFLRDCSAFAGLPEAFNRSIYLTPRLDRDEIQAAIEEPARVFGGNLTAELVRKLINDADNKHDQLPLMQHVLERMWSKAVVERPGKPPVLTLDDYAAVGEISKALNQDAETAYEEELKPGQQKIAEVIFRALCVRGSSYRDTRALARVDQIARLAGVKWQEVAHVAEVFRSSGRHFLSPHAGKLGPNTVLDITHESLIRNWKRLQDWVEDEANAAEAYQRLEREAREWKAGGDVLSPARVAAINNWEKCFHPTAAWAERYGGNFDLAMDFLKASRAKHEEEERKAKSAAQQKELIKRLGIALVIAVALVGWAIYQTIMANRFLGQAMMFRAQAELSSGKPLSALPLYVSAPKHDSRINPLTAMDYFPLPHVHYARQIHHSAEVITVAINPMGTLLAVALRNGSVDLADPVTGTITHNLPFSKSPRESQQSYLDAESVRLSFSPGGDRLYCAAEGNELHAWSIPDGKPLESSAFSNTITGFAMTQSGLVAVGLNDGTLEILRDGKKVDSSRDEQSARPLRSLVFCPDERLVAGIIAGRLRLWRIEDSKLEPLGVQFGPAGTLNVSAVGFSPDAKKLVLCAPDRQVSLWNLPPLESLSAEAGGQSSPDISGPKSKAVQLPVPTSPSDSERTLPKIKLLRLVASDKAPTIREELETNIRLPAQQRPVNSSASISVAMDPDSNWVYWLAGDRYLGAWSPAKGAAHAQFVRTSGLNATSVAVSPSGLWLAVGGVDVAGQGTTRLWLLETERSIAKKAKKELPPIHAVSVGKDGEILAVGSDENGVRMWRANAVQELGSYDSDVPEYLSGDGKLLVSSIGTWYIFDVAAQEELAAIKTSGEGVYAFNGPMFAQTEGSTVVTLWDSKKGTRVGDFAAVKNTITDLEFGREHLAVAGDQDQIAIWDTHDPAHAQKGVTMSTSTAQIEFIAFAEAENMLAAACNDRTVRLFDAKSGLQTTAITIESAPRAISFSTDGKLVAVGLENGTIQIWDCIARNKLGEVAGWNTGETELGFTRQNELVAGMNNRFIDVWSPKGALIRVLRGEDWRPGSEDDTMRLSGLILDGFDVRPITPEEEQGLKIDMSGSAENIKSAEYWSAYRATERNFGNLAEGLKRDSYKSDSYITALDVNKADVLVPWIKKYAEGPGKDALFLAVAQKAEREFLNAFVNIYTDFGKDVLLRGDYGRAISVFDEILKIAPQNQARTLHALRGFAKQARGDEAGAAEDLQLYNDKPANLQAWEYLLYRRRLVQPSEALIASSFLIWLQHEYERAYESRATASFLLRKYDDALADVNKALSLLAPRKGQSNPQAGITLQSTRLFLLRGRILDAQGSPDGRHDWEQVAEDLAADKYSKACAQMLLGQFDAALPYFEEEVRENPASSIPQYHLAAFFALRAASRGPGSEAQRTSDLDAAIEALQRGVQLGSDSLAKFRIWTTDLQSLENDPRLRGVLSQEENSPGPADTVKSR